MLSNILEVVGLLFAFMDFSGFSEILENTIDRVREKLKKLPSIILPYCWRTLAIYMFFAVATVIASIFFLFIDLLIDLIWISSTSIAWSDLGFWYVYALVLLFVVIPVGLPLVMIILLLAVNAVIYVLYRFLHLLNLPSGHTVGFVGFAVAVIGYVLGLFSG